MALKYIYQRYPHSGYNYYVIGEKQTPADDNDITDVIFEIKQPTDTRKPWGFARKCRPYCGINLHRRHITCLTCPVEAVAQKKIPNMFPVTARVIQIPLKDKFVQSLRGKTLKAIISIIGMLSW